MKNKNFLVALVLLAGVTLTLADVCGQGAPTAVSSGGSAGVSVVNTNDLSFATSGTPPYSCTCPTGTGEIVAVSGSTALPAVITSSGATAPTFTGVTYGVTAGSDATASTVTLTGPAVGTASVLTRAYIAQLCLDLLPGFQIATNSSATISTAVTPCGVGEYCPGVANLFAGAAVASSGVTSSAYPTNLVIVTSTSLAGNTFVLGTGPAVGTACPSGTTNTGANTQILLTSCTDLAIGWAFNPSVSASTSLSALLTQCAAGNYGCAGKTGVFVTQTAGAWGTTGITFGGTTCALASTTAINSGCAITTAAANAGANIIGTCPAYATNKFTTTSNPTWAATAATAIQDCADLAVGWAFNPSIGSSGSPSTNLTALLTQCAAGKYGCAGQTAIFKNTISVVSGAFGTTGISSGTTTTTVNTVLTSATTLTTGVYTAAANAGANIIGTCPAYATNTFTARGSPRPRIQATSRPRLRLHHCRRAPPHHPPRGGAWGAALDTRSAPQLCPEYA